MCLKAYVDDSGSDPSSRVFVLGGIVMPAGWWERCSGDWTAVLRAPPSVEYFKASEVWERKPDKKSPFLSLTDDERRRKVDALVDVLCGYHPAILSCRLEWDVFRQFSSKQALPEGKENPYFWLFYGMLGLCAYKVNYEESNPAPVDFVFDNQNAIGDSAKEYYDFFKANCTERLQAVLGAEPKFGDEKLVIPLQAADLFAWYRRRDHLGSLYQEWHQRIYKALDQVSHFQHYRKRPPSKHGKDAGHHTGLTMMPIPERYPNNKARLTTSQ